ncbi:hypothetical protein BDN72DRAFT_235179 [Pluteus cervinus]|uniref:Uncharacterized protein n=1 Tax=Pluteus cervinus TaxID=181527 RepID=A0ACD3BER3_9AGAR|nr:hypothetical protein BDN72DRAFT_235179 [Pluteus cervinus]
MSGDTSRKPSGSSSQSATHSPSSSPNHGQSQRKSNTGTSSNMYGVGIGSANGLKSLGSGWQVR